MTTLLNELRNNLVTAHELGNEEWAKALEKRIKLEEKALEPEPEKPKPAAKPATKVK